MLINFWNSFVKITGWPVEKLALRTKVYYEDKSVQSRKIKGPAIIISNHTNVVFDYVSLLFVFFGRTLRVQMAEVLFRKKPLGSFLKMIGGIYVDRYSHNFSFIEQSKMIIEKGGIVLIFPEGRIPLGNEKRPLEFKPGAAYLALLTDAPIIPVYTNGQYKKKRNRVLIGKPLNIKTLINGDNATEKNIEIISKEMRDKIIDLEKILNAKTGKAK